MKFLKAVVSSTEGLKKAEFTSGAVTTDLRCAQFFMTMQDRGATLEDALSYAKVGPNLSPTVDWDEINRVLATFKE